MRIAVQCSRTECITAGVEPRAWGVIEIAVADLTSDERRVLASAPAAYSSAPAADAYLLDTCCALKLAPATDATPDSVRARLAEMATAPARRGALDQAHVEAQIAAILATPSTAWRQIGQGYVDEGVGEVGCTHYHPIRPDYVRQIAGSDIRMGYADPRIWHDPRIVARVQTEDAETQRLRAAEKTRVDEIVAVRAAEAAIRTQALRSWAESHGSELLRARIAGSYEWESLARSEYANAVIAAVAPGLAPAVDPDLAADDDEKLEYENRTRTRPELSEIAGVNAIREAAKTHGYRLDAVPAWIIYRTSQDELQRAEIEIHIFTPDEASVERFVLPPAALRAGLDAERETLLDRVARMEADRNRT
jgi:hypothetical protein